MTELASIVTKHLKYPKFKNIKTKNSNENKSKIKHFVSMVTNTHKYNNARLKDYKSEQNKSEHTNKSRRIKNGCWASCAEQSITRNAFSHAHFVQGRRLRS
jgi:hypothetical protein